MGKYFVPTKGPETWKQFLADPEKQRKGGYSAYELATCWEEANNLPTCVDNVFKQSNIPLFHNVKVLFGFPEYTVPLSGGNKSSQNDLYILAKSDEDLLTIMVEGKVSEPFGKTVNAWLGANPSDGKRKRLESLLSLLELQEDSVHNIRYQLLHRAASAILEARRINAKHSLMLVHSFSDIGKWFEDYVDFVKLFHLDSKKDSIVGPVTIDGISLYFGWVTGKNTNMS